MKTNKYESLRLYGRILSYLRPYVALIGLILTLNFMYVIFNTLSIWMVAPFISTLFEKESPRTEQVVTPDKQLHAEPQNVSFFNINKWLKVKTESLLPRGNRLKMLQMMCIIIFLAFFLKNLFSFSEAYFVSYVEQKVIKDLRDEAYAHVMRQPLHFFQKYDTGNLISRITNDINSLNVAVNRSFTKIIRDPIVILIFVAILLSISWQLTLLAFLVIPLSGVLIQKIGQSLNRKSRRVQERIADLTTKLQESISGVKVVKAFGMEETEINRFKEVTQHHFGAVLRQVRLNRLSSPLSETLGVGIMVSVLWFGGRLVLSGELLTSEDFIRFIIILFSVMEPIKSIGQLNNNVQIALASGKRVFDIMDEPNPITNSPDALEKKSFLYDIRYESVSFKYSENENWVLRNINLQIKKNQQIALVGSSGAGKTTLVNLLPRFYDVTSGAIKIDGIDIRKIYLKDLRRLIGMVSQDVFLFNDTITRNIAYGIDQPDMEKVKWAAKMANAYDFIMELPRGFQTIISERGTRLSGGQRQRISIARAIMKDPPILVFDEATSALDSEAEKLIQEAMEHVMKNRTSIIIAHRLSTVLNSDQIVVLENGEILDIGTHEELLAHSPRYQQLYNLQFSV